VTVIVDEKAVTFSTKSDLRNKAKIFAIGGGKGGVGKTVLAASFGVGLAMLGKRVVVVDADFGGPNLHRVMGIEKPDKTYLCFHQKESNSLDDILIPHPLFDNLKIMSGAVGVLGVANMYFGEKTKLIRQIQNLDTDFVILDIGSGSSYNVLDFFIAANQGIVVVNPDPLSILEGYNFVKQTFFRKLMRTLKNCNGTWEIIQKFAYAETHPNLTVEELLREIAQINEEVWEQIRTWVNAFRPMLLINEVTGSKDEENGLAVRVAARELLSIDMEYLGVIHHEDLIIKSLQAGIPFICYDPKNRASSELISIILTKILHEEKLQPIVEEKTIYKNTKQKNRNRNEECVCSEKCSYWEVCEFRKKSYPCELGGF